MDLKKEVEELTNMNYSSENERDVVLEFARTALKYNDINSIKTAYNGYYSFRRNFPNYNGYASDIIEKIYKTKINESKRFT